MAHKGPIRNWEYLAVGTIVPAPGGARIPASCALCAKDTWIDPKGALYTAPNDGAVVCDACGEKEAPDAMALVRQLRASSPFTATVGGVGLEEDVWAFMCPVCYKEQEPEERIEGGVWRVVDGEHGRQVCSSCLSRVDPGLVKLVEALEQLERSNQAFNAIDMRVKH